MNHDTQNNVLEFPGPRDINHCKHCSWLHAIERHCQKCDGCKRQDMQTYIEYEIQGLDSLGMWTRMCRMVTGEHKVRERLEYYRENSDHMAKRPPYRVVRREILETNTEW